METAKTVLITGASKGIGRAAAFEFAENGWKVFGLARNKDGALSAVQKETGEKFHSKKVSLEKSPLCMKQKTVPLSRTEEPSVCLG